ncbi:MAG: hypothetical protein ACYCXA_14520 [Actinomycetes bacterium]
MKALLDMSFLVATGSGRSLGEMPGGTETEVPVVTGDRDHDTTPGTEVIHV